MVCTVFFYRGVPLKEYEMNKDKFFPSKFQDVAMRALQVTFNFSDKASWYEKEQSMFRYVANARKRWLTKPEYQTMIKDLGREEAKFYDKKNWVDTRELMVHDQQFLQKLEVQREWAKEVIVNVIC